MTYTDNVGDGMEYSLYQRGVSYYEQIIYSILTQASVKPDKWHLHLWGLVSIKKQRVKIIEKFINPYNLLVRKKL